MVIYSTLIDAATEHVEIFGKAGSTTIREIKIENQQDSTIVLFIEKVSSTMKMIRGPWTTRFDFKKYSLNIQNFSFGSKYLHLYRWVRVCGSLIISKF